MNVAILGTEQPSQIVAQLIEHHYNPWLTQRLGEPINITAYVTWGGGAPPNIGNIAVLNHIQFALLYHKKAIDKIIFPREIFFETQKAMLTQLRVLDVDFNDIFVSARLKASLDLMDFITSYPAARYLPHIEFRIAEHCNLNCKMCTEYCALVKESKFMSLEKFAQDFAQLHKFIDDFGAMRILGGEPLLNPEINQYVKIGRRLYPYANIHIVTNAILLPKMPDDFFETVRQNNAVVEISFYPLLQSKMPEIQRLLEKKQVLFRIGPLNAEFTIKQTLRRHDHAQRIFLQCVQANCHNLYEGQIAACFLPFTTKYFNAYYHKNLPEDGALDLYDENLTTEKLKAHLLTPFERCRYCTRPVAVKWDTVKHPSPITDWTNDHLLASPI